MKKINLIFSFAVLLAVMVSCGVPDGISQDTTVDKSITVGPVDALFDITNDNSGNVTITPNATGPASYSVYFGDKTAQPALVQYASSVTHKYAEGNYTVKVIANGLNGVNSEKTYPLSIVYRAPENLAVTMTKKAHLLKVQANAAYAASYLVYFGDAGLTEVGTPLENGADVSHVYASQGTYDVKVIALSGGAATTEKTTSTIIYDPLEMPITFESPYVQYTFTGGLSFSKVNNVNPSGNNTSSKIAKFLKVFGVAANVESAAQLNSPVDFSNGFKVKVWAYNPKVSNIGKKVTIELASAVGGSPADGIAVFKSAFTTSGAWEELVFDFSTIPTIPFSPLPKFDKLIIRFDDGNTGKSDTFYLDQFRFEY